MIAIPLRRLLAALLLALAFAAPAAAGDRDAALADLKLQAAALQRVYAKGIVTAAQRDQGVAAFVAEAKALDPTVATEADLMAVKAALPTLEERRTSGLLDFLDTSRVIAGALGVLCVLTLAWYYISTLRALFAAVPLGVYEAAMYAASAALVVGASRVADWGTHLAFLGCLLFGGTIALSARIRRRDPNPTAFFGLLAAVWAPVAVWYSSELVGFLAAMALMGALGFSAAATPLCYMIGFRDGESTARATVAGFLLLGAFAVLKTVGHTVPALAVFEKGALFMGSFVGYLGVLILSSKWYRRDPGFYAAMQVAALVLGVAALALGPVLGIPELQKIGGSFFVLWIVEKLSEIPVRTVRGWAFLGLAAAVGVYLAADAVQAHLDAIRPYVLFL